MVETDRGTDLEASLARHDAQVAARGLDLWFGAEPTFTDRFSFADEWRTAALGPEKQARGRALAAALAREIPGADLLRTRGRQYPGEPTPRWSLGVYSPRDGRPCWAGPPDPLIAPPATSRRGSAGRLRDALAEELRAGGHTVLEVDAGGALGARLLFADDPAVLADGDWASDPRVVRPPLDTLPVRAEAPGDELAVRGVHLVCLGTTASLFPGDRGAVEVELPAFPRTASFLAFLELLGRAARVAGTPALLLTDFPPPVDETVAWTTVTPDPGVVEVNMAPCPNARTFFDQQRRLYRLAAAQGLSPHQLLFNGEVVDSGGGQHITFGGPRPEKSPFFRTPRLLPRLVAYVQRHPSLSYWFAVRAVGSCSQQPRADEGAPEALDGLAVGLAALERTPEVSPELLWRSLSPFLTDRFGNAHRAEINVEKLWNPHLSDRGKLGLVEMRAFRMTRTPERAAAVAVLCRSVLALLCGDSAPEPELQPWGAELHDRFSLPFYLRRDLDDVLWDLDRGGLGLGDEFTRILLDDSHALLAERDLEGVVLTVRLACQFWPVVGDGTGAEQTFRLMDASTVRVELSLRAAGADPGTLRGWRLVVEGYEVPWVEETEGERRVLLRGLRYKAFQPTVPVLPLVPPRDPLEVTLVPPHGGGAYRLRLHGWRPDGGAYDGLPADFADARRRCEERLVLETCGAPGPGTPPPAGALTECCLDLRRLP